MAAFGQIRVQHSTTMSGRQGGKLKPLKAPKAAKKEDDDEDIALKAKKKAEADALKAAKDKGTNSTRSLEAIADV
jgi:hypothetical protein